MSPDPNFGQYLESRERLEAYLASINELLPNASPIGAYCLGISFPFIRSSDPQLWPTRELLLALSSVATVKEGTRLAEEWLIRRSQRRKAQP